MPKLSATALKARIDELQKQLASAEANKVPAINKVRALMKELGVTLEDLGEGKSPGRRGRPAKATQANGAAAANGRNGGKPKTARAKVAIKYRDESGNTWTGRGKRPRWMVEAEKAGKSRDSFKVG